MESNLTRSGTYSRVNLQIASFFYYLVVLAFVVDSHNIVLGAILLAIFNYGWHEYLNKRKQVSSYERNSIVTFSTIYTMLAILKSYNVFVPPLHIEITIYVAATLIAATFLILEYRRNPGKT